MLTMPIMHSTSKSNLTSYSTFRTGPLSGDRIMSLAIHEDVGSLDAGEDGLATGLSNDDGRIGSGAALERGLTLVGVA